MVLEYMDRGTAQHLSKEGLLDLEGTPRASQHCLSLHYHSVLVCASVLARSGGLFREEQLLEKHLQVSSGSDRSQTATGRIGRPFA